MIDIQQIVINIPVYKPVYSVIKQANKSNSCSDAPVLSTHRIMNRIVDNRLNILKHKHKLLTINVENPVYNRNITCG